MSDQLPPQTPTTPNTIARFLAGSVLAVLALFLLTGLFDYIYFRSVIGTFEQGLGEINWINPHLGKAVIAAVSSVATILFFRYEAASFSFISRPIGRFVTSSFILVSIYHTILTFATWGNIFDSVGHSHLYYGIDDNNQVRYFNPSGDHSPDHPPHHPQTGEVLIAVTPENVREVEIRRHATFLEIKDPSEEMWFAPGTGRPMLWYSEREDGFHFFNLPGFDRARSRKLEPVTPELQQRYLAARKAKQQQVEAEQKEAKKLANEAEQARIATQQARNAVERERAVREDADRQKAKEIAQKETDERLRSQRLAEAKRHTVEEEQQRQQEAIEAKRRSEDQLRRQRQEAIADDNAKGSLKDGNGELAMNSAYVRNLSAQQVKFQLLTEVGWEPKTIKPNGTLFVLSNCDLKIRWWEGDKYRKGGLNTWHQTHYSFSGVNPDEMRRNAPINNLTIDSDGHFMFELGTR